MRRDFKRIIDQLDCPVPSMGKAIGWDSQGKPANLDISNSNTITGLAGEALGGSRAVIKSVGEYYYADNQDEGTVHKIYGITTQSAVQGAPVDIRTTGEITEPSWSWNTDLPIWLGSNGLLTQVCPTTGYAVEIGFPVDSHTINIKLGAPIKLST